MKNVVFFAVYTWQLDTFDRFLLIFFGTQPGQQCNPQAALEAGATILAPVHKATKNGYFNETHEKQYHQQIWPNFQTATVFDKFSNCLREAIF